MLFKLLWTVWEFWSSLACHHAIKSCSQCQHFLSKTPPPIFVCVQSVRLSLLINFSSWADPTHTAGFETAGLPPLHFSWEPHKLWTGWRRQTIRTVKLGFSCCWQDPENGLLGELRSEAATAVVILWVKKRLLLWLGKARACLFSCSLFHFPLLVTCWRIGNAWEFDIKR